MSDRVCAVVVTFNRKELLKGTLEALSKQTRPLDAIVVVNNASTDGTERLLAEEYSHLNQVHLPENVGGSGGFHAGMKWGYEHGFDWVWVMDDDIQPYPGTLEHMLKYKSLSGFIHVRREDGSGPYVWEGMWDVGALQKFSYPTEVSFGNGKEWTAVNYGNFEGALIHRSVIDRIGLPDVRFFLGGDDSIYGYLASFHTNVIYVNHIGIRRMLPNPRGTDASKLYFGFRNRSLTYEYLAAANVPVSRVYFWIHIFVLIAWMLVNMPAIRTRQHLSRIYQGLRDGMRRKFGRPDWLSSKR